MSSVAETQNRSKGNESYDKTPYPGGAFRPTHPTHIAMVAHLFGLTPPLPRRCRVLELGCSMGFNIIPMALEMPDCEFVGIDLSANQIESGMAVIDEFGLENIRLFHKSILDVDEKMGMFDFILCHGVYSWVPPNVQRKVLSIGSQNLSDNGIMFVSYNTLPGWNLRGTIRDMMRYHVQGLETPEEKVGQARALLNYLSTNSTSGSEAYKSLLKHEASVLQSKDDYYIYHEHLEEFNEALYFHEFVSRLEGSGIRYLADANIADSLAPLFQQSEDVFWNKLSLLGREQYMDFMTCRTFRCSLLCRETICPSYAVNSSPLESMHVCFLEPVTRTELPSGDVRWDMSSVQFITQGTETREWDQLHRRFPGWISVRELLDNAIDQSMRPKILDDLLVAFVRGVVQLALEPNLIVPLSDRPVCSAYCQRQARLGDRITSRRHFEAVVTPLQRFLLRNSDGTHDERSLSAMWLSEAKKRGEQESSEGAANEIDMLGSQTAVHAELVRLSNLGFFVS